MTSQVAESIMKLCPGSERCRHPEMDIFVSISPKGVGSSFQPGAVTLHCKSDSLKWPVPRVTPSLLHFSVLIALVRGSV